ncbi:folliculin-interacting protein 2-like isoform X2 [Choristoneura fumiferana]|uniref:folliculin-interacting protein 2-like isoform X2 n=1 Tax=Choristoneura fumiferana TaxID=7141 RepID=UPI003D1549EF
MKIRSCQITSQQVRLLLFKECDWRGRKLLFDSSTIEKVPAGKDNGAKQAKEFPCIVEVSEGFAYVYKGPAADASVLGEMIFGAVAMNCKGVSLKIHIMDEPKRLMCTKVFCVPVSRRISRVNRKPDGSDTELRERSKSKPLNVPLQKEEVSLSFSIDRGDSGYYGDQTPHSSIGSTYDYFSMFDVWDGSNSQDDLFSFHTPSGRKLSTSSNGSWQRRTFRNLATRFDLSNSSNFLSVPSNATSDSQIYSNSSTSGTSDSLASGSSSALKKNKLGLALLITVPDSADKDFVRRCVEMSPQLQSLVCRLRLATMTAGTGSKFVATLHQAASDAAGWLSDLIEGPRLQPMWLQLVTSERPRAHKMADTLLQDLCAVLAVGDTKNTNFFISTLLTHVLTYHLGWVTTVSPYDTMDPQKRPDGSAEHRRPYNALWAQLADLCGTIGFPPRAARTIVCGSTNLQFVNRLLVVLTYFVRCGDVTRSDFEFDDSALKESETVTLKRTATRRECNVDSVKVSQEESSASTLVSSEAGFRRTATLANLTHQLSTSVDFEQCRSSEKLTGPLRRNPTMMLKSSSDSSLDSNTSEETEAERKVVFVLGDDDKLVGLKNKSNGGKSVKSSLRQAESIEVVQVQKVKEETKDNCDQKPSCQQICSRSSESPSKCCSQTLQHSKPIKHSGFKFEFDKYPQIVTNYMKSKNLEILDRHYIGKPGNLKLDNFQFDPTIVPPIQEERCEACYKCQMMESLLQTPTNASELEYMNDVPRQSEPQFAKEAIVEQDSISQVSPKTFVRRKQEATLVVNVSNEPRVVVEASREDACGRGKEWDGATEVQQVIEFSVPRLVRRPAQSHSGFDGSLLGGLSDHYVPDLILQGTIGTPAKWEGALRRDLELVSCMNKASDASAQAVAIVGDTESWEVRVMGRECGSGGMSALVGGMLDALPVMWKAKVPAYQCLSYLESKLREFCVLSKTLADMLMSTDFCDIATLTKSLNIDVNDVPLLLAIATTHTPQVATRYGISYR